MTRVVLLRSAERRHMLKAEGWVRPSFAGCSVRKAMITSPTSCLCTLVHSVHGRHGAQVISEAREHPAWLRCLCLRTCLCLSRRSDAGQGRCLDSRLSSKELRALLAAGLVANGVRVLATADRDFLNVDEHGHRPGQRPQLLNAGEVRRWDLFGHANSIRSYLFCNAESIGRY